MNDETEGIRREMVEHVPSEREKLEGKYGQLWDTGELTRDFTVEGFMAPFVVVTRKSDGQKGVMEFQHSPRYYYSFEPVSKR
jgi:hypothetical protein